MVNIIALFDVSVSVCCSFDPPWPSRCTRTKSHFYKEKGSRLHSHERIFTIADVKAGNWIFYEGQDYHGPSVKKQRVVESHVSISDVNGSVFLVEEGLILFKDTDFRGERKVLRI